jgi:hypothetical protein
MNTTGNICQVCGYDNLESPCWIGDICDCCGVEYGVSDEDKSYDELRREWIIENHAAWWSPFTPPPSGWNALRQLQRIHHIPTRLEMAAICQDRNDAEVASATA